MGGGPTRSGPRNGWKRIAAAVGDIVVVVVCVFSPPSSEELFRPVTTFPIFHSAIFMRKGGEKNVRSGSDSYHELECI